MKLMKITKIATRFVNLSFESTIKTAIHEMSSVGCVLLTIETDEGIEGQSYLFSLNATQIKKTMNVISFVRIRDKYK